MNPNPNETITNLHWTWILTLKELAAYLSKNELIQLGTLCKYLREKLKPYIYEHLDLNNYSPDYGPVFQKEYCFNSNIIHNQIEKLKRDLRGFQPFTTSVSLYKDFNYALLLQIPIILNNLKQVGLFEIHMPLEAFIQLINRLQSLETLGLYYTSMIIWNDFDQSKIQLCFPKSLKCLYFGYCKVISSTYSSNTLNVFHDHYDTNTSEMDFFQFPTHHLPNLYSFKCLDRDEQVIPIVNEFISNNSHLRHYEVNLILFNQRGLDFLLACHNLSHLRIRYNYILPYRFQELTFPTLNSLRHLDFDSISKGTFNVIQRLCLSCPNITHLGLCYKPGFISALNTIITKLTHLDSLSLTNRGNHQTFIENKLSDNSIKQIKLDRFNPLNVDFSKLQHCSQLSHVTVKLFGDEKDDPDGIHLYYDHLDGWSCFIYPGSIRCYKI